MSKGRVSHGAMFVDLMGRREGRTRRSTWSLEFLRLSLLCLSSPLPERPRLALRGSGGACIRGVGDALAGGPP